MSKQSAELRRYCELHGIKNKFLEEKLNLSSGAVSSILSGRYGISKENAVALSELFGFSIPFLLSGEGELFPVSQSVGTGAIVNGGRVEGGINVTATNAALQAENERLRNEVEWLRQQLSK